MLLLFVGYYVDVNFFVHAHIINGVTIVHSHVHNQHHHDSEEGGHTISEITLIASLTNQFLATDLYPQPDLTPFFILFQSIGAEQQSPRMALHLLSLSLRAPPVC